MNKQISEGDYVHVPADTYLFDLDEGGHPSGIIKTQKPLVLMFLGEMLDPAFGDPICKVFYEGNIMSTMKENVYAYRKGEGDE
jgi:hypothetical protein